MGVYAYLGPLSLLTAGDEVKDIRSFPKAMFWAFATFILIYTLAIFVLVGLVDSSQYSTMESPFTTAATYVFGDFAGLVINIAAWIAAVTCLIGEIFSVSRLTHGMAVEKALPPVLAKVDKKGNPYVGVIFGYIVAVIIVLIGSFEALENFYLTIATLGSVAGTLNMTICLIASFLYKRKFPEEWANLCWHMPLRKITYPLAFIGCIALFISLYAGAISALIPSVIFVALIILFYLFYSSKHIDKTEA